MRQKSVLAVCKKMGYVVEPVEDRPVSDYFYAKTDKSDHFLRWHVQRYQGAKGEVEEVTALYCSDTAAEKARNPYEDGCAGYYARSVQVAVAHMEAFRYQRPVYDGIHLVIDCKCEARGRALVYSVRIEVAREKGTDNPFPFLWWYFDFTEAEKVAFLRGQPNNGVLLDFLEENSSKFGELRAEKPIKKWIVQDWAGNRMYPDKVFNTFEDGWEYVRADHPDSQDWEDIFVVEEFAG